MNARSLPLVLGVALAIAVAACSSGSKGTAPSTPPGPGPAASSGGAPGATGGGGTSSAVESQVQRGAAVYASMCVKCHGGSGEGSATAPRLVGAGALPAAPRAGSRLRTTTFRTAMEVGQFILGNMPPGARIEKADCGAVVAWLMRQNGIPMTQPISPSTAGSVPLR